MVTAPPPLIDPSISSLVVGLGVAIIGGIFTVLVAWINRIGKKKSEDTDQLASFVSVLQGDNAALRENNEALQNRNELLQNRIDRIQANYDRLHTLVVGQVEAAAAIHFPPDPPQLPPTT